MPPRRWIAALAALAILAALCLPLSVLAVGLILSAPSPAVIGEPPPDLTGAVRVEFWSASGALLQGWWLPGRAGGGAVVLMHGVHGNRIGLLGRARLLQDQGCAVLLFDFQAHGESTGKRITFGKLEGLDAAAAVRFVRQKLPNERVAALGISLGGTAALLGPTPLNVDALVLESVYPTIDDALANRLHAALGPVIGGVATPVLAPLFELLLPPILGVRPAELRPIDRIGQTGMPLLMASGTIDDRTPLSEAQALFSRAPRRDRDRSLFWAVEGAGHVDLERHDPEGYRRIVLPFLLRHLRAES